MSTTYYLDGEGECTFCHCKAELANVVNDDSVVLGLCGPCTDFWIYAPSKRGNSCLQEDAVALMSAISADAYKNVFGTTPPWKEQGGPWNPGRYRK